MITQKMLLVAAKTLLLHTGWCQKQYAKTGGKALDQWLKNAALAEEYCIVGALYKASYTFWLVETDNTAISQIPYNRLCWDAQLAIKRLADWDKSLAELNDSPEMTGPKMMALIDRAICN